MEEQNNSLSLLSLVKTVLKSWKWLLLSILICLGLTVLYILVTQPVYQIESNILIKNESEKSSSPMASLLQGFSFGSFFRSRRWFCWWRTTFNQFIYLGEKHHRSLGINVIYTSGNLFSKKDYYNNSPFTIKSDSHIEDKLGTVISFKIKTQNDGTVHVKAKESMWSPWVRFQANHSR
jgi:hypothetical protein